MHAGIYHCQWGDFPRLQLLTIEELLSGAQIKMPPLHQVNLTFKKAEKQKKEEGVIQLKLKDK